MTTADDPNTSTGSMADRFGPSWIVDESTSFVTCNLCGAAVHNSDADMQLHYLWHPEK